MKQFIRSIVVVFVILLIGSIGSVNALWTYFNDVETVSNAQNFLMEEFYYVENVPDDEEHEISHNALLQKIVDKEEGLNNPNSLLSRAVRDRFEDDYNTVSSNQKVTGGNLKNVFSTIEGFEYVGFLIVKINDKEYYVYTYDNRNTTSIGRTIETYLTHLHLREGVWILSGGFQGTAVTIKYDGQTNGPYKNTINHTTFVRTYTS